MKRPPIEAASCLVQHRTFCRDHSSRALLPAPLARGAGTSAHMANAYATWGTLLALTAADVFGGGSCETAVSLSPPPCLRVSRFIPMDVAMPQFNRMWGRH